MLMTRHYPDLDGDASSERNFFARLSDACRGETSGAVAKCRLLSHANLPRDA